MNDIKHMKKYKKAAARVAFCSSRAQLYRIHKPNSSASKNKVAKWEARLASAKLDLDKAMKKQTYSLPEETVLELRGLSMYFGGLHAVDDLSFSVKKGEIFGLIGPNGAGKTTVFNCITQFNKPTHGEIIFRNKYGRVVNLNEDIVHDVILHGISRTFQNVEVIREVTVLENMLIAATRQYTSTLFEQMFHLPVLGIEEKVITAKALEILDFMGLLPYKDSIAFGLPYGVLKKIEMARTLMCDPRLIILDEPAAGLNDSETADLAHLIRRIGEQFNCSILLVEHDMGLVMEVCDRICAISFGKMLCCGTPEEIQSNRAVQEAYLGVKED